MTHEEFKKRFKYSLETDRLGEGGFGEVFKAYDNFIDKWVAIKISKVKPDFQDIRLRKEVELVNKLPAHPNIARYEECYTFSSIAGEYDFGILQYYEEGNLLQLMHNRKLTSDEKFLILKDLLEGIEFMHKNNIIHRDLKPQNILIVKRGDYYVPKITDFGISKKLDILKGSEYSNSLTGAGTLAYAAPEQLGGKAIRKNSDLWAFGVIAYQLLSGQLPFTSGTFGTTSEAGRQEMLRQINQGISPVLLDMITQPWQLIIRYCLETDPEFRIRSASDCLDILEGKSTRISSRGSANNSKSISLEDGVTEIIISATPSVKLKNRMSVKKVIIAGSALILILIAAIGFRFVLNDKPKINLVEKSTLAFPAKDTVSIPIKSNVEEIKPQLKEEKGIAEVKTEIIASASKLTFDNGNYYEGKIKAGKMHGKGVFYFVNGGLISKDDPLERQAEAGSYIEGEWFNGDLYKGRLFDKNKMMKEEIILGRN